MRLDGTSFAWEPAAQTAQEGHSVARIPAFCDHCGAIFPSPINLVAGVTGAGVIDCATNCPRCGQAARILSGIFNVPTESTFHVVGASAQTIADIRRFATILDEARAQRTPPEEVARRVQAEAPRYACLFGQLLIPKTSGDFYGLLGALAGAIAIALSQVPAGPSDKQIGEHVARIERSIETAVERIHERLAVVREPPIPQTKPKPPKQERNDLCACGSGKKHKKCCGR
jgi:hypothetical protein